MCMRDEPILLASNQYHGTREYSSTRVACGWKFVRPSVRPCVRACVPGYHGYVYSRVEIIRGIAPVRPGPYITIVFIELSFSLQEQARNRLCRYLYWISNKELRRLASYYAQSNFYVPPSRPISFSRCMYVCTYVCRLHVWAF